MEIRRVITFCMLCILSVSVYPEITISSITVTGTNRLSEQWVGNRIHLKEHYGDEGELNEALDNAGIFLLHSGYIQFVEFFSIPLSETRDGDQVVEIYAAITENFMPVYPSNSFPSTLFGDIPFSGWAGGFNISETSQMLAAFPVNGPPAAAGFFLGHSLIEGYSTIQGSILIRVDLLPCWVCECGISGYLPVSRDNFEQSILGRGTVSLTADYLYLLETCGIGFSSSVTGHLGYSDAFSLASDIGLSVPIAITSFLRITLKAGCFISIYPATHDYSAEDYLSQNYRGRTPEGYHDRVFLGSVELRLPEVLTFNIKICDLSFSPFLFADALAERNSPALGGGLELSLGIPIHLTFIFGYGYAPGDICGKFIFGIE